MLFIVLRLVQNVFYPLIYANLRKFNSCRIYAVEKARTNTSTHNSSEESEFNALKYDLEHGMKLLPHKMKRYNELKEKLGK